MKTLGFGALIIVAVYSFIWCASAYSLRNQMLKLELYQSGFKLNLDAASFSISNFPFIPKVTLHDALLKLSYKKPQPADVNQNDDNVMDPSFSYKEPQSAEDKDGYTLIMKLLASNMLLESNIAFNNLYVSVPGVFTIDDNYKCDNLSKLKLMTKKSVLFSNSQENISSISYSHKNPQCIDKDGNNSSSEDSTFYIKYNQDRTVDQSKWDVDLDISDEHSWLRTKLSVNQQLIAPQNLKVALDNIHLKQNGLELNVSAVEDIYISQEEMLGKVIIKLNNYPVIFTLLHDFLGLKKSLVYDTLQLSANEIDENNLTLIVEAKNDTVTVGKKTFLEIMTLLS